MIVNKIKICNLTVLSSEEQEIESSACNYENTKSQTAEISGGDGGGGEVSLKNCQEKEFLIPYLFKSQDQAVVGVISTKVPIMNWNPGLGGSGRSTNKK